MDTFRQHEVFEIEIIDALHRGGCLDPLVFGGGTMLRLCPCWTPLPCANSRPE